MKPFVKGLPVKRVVLAGSFGLLVLIGCRGDERPFEEAIEVQRLGLRTLTIERPEGAPERVPDGVAEDFSIGVGERLALSLNGQGSGSSAVEIDTGDRDWRVEDAAVLGVSRDGVLTGRADGTTQLSVSIGGVRSEVLNVRVSGAELSSIASIDGAAAPDRCSASRYVAIGAFADGSSRLLGDVDWTPGAGASLRKVESDDPATGATRVVPTSVGELSLTASVGGVTATRQLQVPATLTELSLPSALQTLRIGATTQLSATATYTGEGTTRNVDVTDGVDWSVSSGDAVTVGNLAGTRGLVEAERAGDAVVQAACGDDISATARVGVSGSGSSSERLSIDRGDRLTLDAGGQSAQLRVSTGDDYDEGRDVTDRATFSSDNVNVATVSVGGLVTSGQIAGNAQILVRFDGASDVIDVTVR